MGSQVKLSQVLQGTPSLREGAKTVTETDVVTVSLTVPGGVTGEIVAASSLPTVCGRVIVKPEDVTGSAVAPGDVFRIQGDSEDVGVVCGGRRVLASRTVTNCLEDFTPNKI